MRILVGSVCRQAPEVLKAHLQTLQWQRTEAKLDFFFICDNAEEPSSAFLLRDFGQVEAATPKTSDGYAVTEGTHNWNVPLFHWLAREKQRILDKALAEGYDAVWLVDSDLLCDPRTLQSLLDTEKQIVSAVFWTRWSPSEHPMPQVWQRHPYGFEGGGYTEGEFLRSLEGGELVQVRGLGACTLIRRGALEAGAAYWPLVDGLPTDGMWQGEDRHFAVRCQSLHLDLWADAWPDVWHCYRPSDRAEIPDILKLLGASQPPTPAFGDHVSVRIEALDEPTLYGHKEFLRGRIGALPVLPEIEEELETLRPGDSAMIRVNFPGWWDLTEYRNRSRLLRITLLDAKSGPKRPKGRTEEIAMLANVQV